MSRHRWTPQQDQALRDAYPDAPTAAVAERLGLRIGQINSRAFQLGLKKSPTYLSSEQSGRLRPGRQPNATCFKPGHKTWNAGRKGWDAGGRSADTRFKPGRPAHEARNYLPVGSERVTRDGLLERKVTDDPSVYPAKRWVAVSRLVWEAANGPVPPGYVVVFKPARHTVDAALITPDALDLVSRGELMRRNSYHTRYPKEVAQLIQLKGALNRKINNRTKGDRT